MASDWRFFAKLALVTVLIVLILYFASGALQFLWLKFLFDRLADTIASATGLDLWLARVIAIVGLALIPAATTALMPALFPNQRAKKRTATLAAVGFLAATFLATYFLTRDNLWGKFYVYDAVTGEVVIHDRAGIDPVTGQERRPIDSPQLARDIRMFQTHKRGQASSAKRILFDIDGNPLYRYFRPPNGKIELYPAFLKRHPTFNEPLEPIDGPIAHLWDQQQTTPPPPPLPPRKHAPKRETADISRAPSLSEVPPGVRTPLRAPRARPLAKPIAIEEGDGFSFSLFGCERKGKTVVCTLGITNRGSLRGDQTNLCGASYLVDNLGNSAENRTTIAFGSTGSGMCGGNTPMNVLVRFWMSTDAFPEWADSVNIVIHDGNWGSFPGTIMFHNVPILQ